MAGLLADLRFALRLYGRTPWQSALAVIGLALAMALVSALSSLWSDLYLRGTPGVSDARGLVSLGRGGDLPFVHLSSAMIGELAERSQTLEGVSGAMLFGRLDGAELNDRAFDGRVEPVLPGFFETVRPRLQQGRGLDEADFAGDGARVMVISHALWLSHFDADPAVVGREVPFQDHQWRVIGVMDPEFAGPGFEPPLLWLPYQRHFRDLDTQFPEMLIDRLPFYKPMLRVRDGTGLAAVQAELRQLLPDLTAGRESGVMFEPEDLFVLRGMINNPQTHRAAQRQVSLLLAAALLITLVAAFNLGIFLLARMPSRQRELALRLSLGAHRRRLSGQLLLESALLVVAASLLGVLLSLWLAAGFRELEFLDDATFSGDILNLSALGFAAGLAALLTVLIALVPIALLKPGRLGEQTRSRSSRPGWFQHAAGVVQLSLAGAVGAAALAFLIHLGLMQARSLGFEPEGVSVASIQFQPAASTSIRIGPADDTTALEAEIRANLLALPGVNTVAFMSPIPGQRHFAISRIFLDDRSIDPFMVAISPGGLDLLGIPLLHGRDFESSDEPATIVSRSLALEAWGRTDVVGEFLSHNPSGEPHELGRIIGVVGDVQFEHPDAAPRPTLYRPGEGIGVLMGGVLFGGQADEAILRSRIDSALQAHSEEFSVGDIQPLSQLAAELTREDRARTLITVLFGLLTLLLSGFGFFAMQRFLVDGGLPEIAIRKALGAGPRRISRQVLANALKLGLPGVMLGSLLGLIVVALLREELISRAVSPALVVGLTAAMLAGLLLLASWQPAARAANARPGDLLRED